MAHSNLVLFQVVNRSGIQDEFSNAGLQRRELQYTSLSVYGFDWYVEIGFAGFCCDNHFYIVPPHQCLSMDVLCVPLPTGGGLLSPETFCIFWCYGVAKFTSINLMFNSPCNFQNLEIDFTPVYWLPGESFCSGQVEHARLAPALSFKVLLQ